VRFLGVLTGTTRDAGDEHPFSEQRFGFLKKTQRYGAKYFRSAAL
jgi:hypothetical protein